MVSQNFLQVFPGVVDVIHGSHVGHRTTRGDVGQDDFLVGRAQNTGRLGHEVNAAKDYVIGVGKSGSLLGQEERIALKVGVLDDFFPLVMVSQDRHRLAQLLFGLMDPLV